MKKVNRIGKMGIFVILVCACFILFRFDTGLVYDAGDYWDRGTRLWQDGKFSFLYIDGFRGYIYPLYCSICNICGGGYNGFRIINSLLISAYFTFILPMMHKEKRGFNDKVVSCIVHWLIFSIFFYGLIIYPLTDLFAIMLCTISILLSQKCNECKKKSTYMVCVFFFGVFLYWMYNTRTIYLFASVYLIILFIIRQIRSRNSILYKVGSVFGAILGGVIAAIPQIYMNYHILGIFSMKVPTNGLMLKQLVWGLTNQRYDTYIGMAESHPVSKMNFIDPVGTALLNHLGIAGFESWSDFFSFLFCFPFEVAGIYARHLINGLLPCWPNQYVTDLDSNKLFYAIGAYVIIFIFLLACFNNSLNDYKVLSSYVGLLIPVVFIIPGSVENRFFATVYIMMIGVLCYNVEWDKMKRFLKIYWLKTTIFFFGGGGLIFSIWSSMLASESVQSIFFYNVR